MRIDLAFVVSAGKEKGQAMSGTAQATNSLSLPVFLNVDNSLSFHLRWPTANSLSLY
jgi:hypothetical protein